MVPSTNPKPRIVVGVDFGTTYTSVAFAHSSLPGDTKLVREWPNGSTGNDSADQVPTVLQYKNLDEETGTRERSWGYEIRKNASNNDTLRWFKLLLQERHMPEAGTTAGSAYAPRRFFSFAQRLRRLSNQDSATQRSSVTLGPPNSFTRPSVTPATETAAALITSNIEPVTVVGDFLECARQVAVGSLGRTWDQDFVSQSRIEYVLSVPAIWSESAKNLMIQAARKAGFGQHRVDFHLVSEPEAAAAYTMKAIQPHDLKKDDTFVICDAGGGTVDLISYKIRQLNPLVIDESVRGTGDLCGAVFIDQRFEDYLRNLLGSSVYDKMKDRTKAAIMDSWEERVKFRFGNSTEKEYEINLPGVPDDETKNIEEGFHTMQMGDVKRMFDPVVDRVVELVKKQIEKVRAQRENVAAVLLVGGFGSSEYLRHCIDKEINSGTENVQVIQPVNARTAIARGALMQGLDGSAVKVRKARKNYGSVSNSGDIDFGDAECMKRAFYDPRESTFKVAGKMSWYVKRNATVSEQESHSIGFYRLVNVSSVESGAEKLIFQDTLEACDLDHAPNYTWKDPDAIYNICKLKSDLSTVPLDKFPRIWGGGMEYFRIVFDLKMSIVGEVLKFEIVYDGKCYGEAQAEFE